MEYQFADRSLLVRALTHSSHANEQGSGRDNERLEFLGDAILGFLVSDLLCAAHPDFSEGRLSKLKGFFVSATNLVKYAESLRLGEYLNLGKGEEKTGGRAKQALLVDAFEAVLGAMYLDGGIDAPRALIARFVGPQIAEIGGQSERFSDFKTALQESLQTRGRGPCIYSLVHEAGPDHQKLFTVEIELDGGVIGRGRGLTRRAAEQAAARVALEDLRRA